MNEQNNTNVIKKTDQMKLIMKMLGIQSNTELSFITDEHVIQYMQKLDKGSSGTDFATKFDKTDSRLVEVLTWLLELNPYFRHSAAELLKNPIFDQVRNIS
jgi:hypothetical protein